MNSHEKQDYKLYRQIVESGVKGCEMCPRPKSWPPFAVHHPLGRHEPWKFDPRNGIRLCARCHDFYEKNLDGLFDDMLLVGVHLDRTLGRLQADWLGCHRFDKDKGPHNVDHDARHAALKAMWKAIKSGEKTRADFRNFSE